MVGERSIWFFLHFSTDTNTTYAKHNIAAHTSHDVEYYTNMAADDERDCTADYESYTILYFEL